MPGGSLERKAEGAAKRLARYKRKSCVQNMADAIDTTKAQSGRHVRADTLAVSPEILGLSLAEPWRRLAAMVVDLVMIALLSQLAGAFLGIAMGLLLALILGTGKGAPIALRAARWVCRIAGGWSYCFRCWLWGTRH